MGSDVSILGREATPSVFGLDAATVKQAVAGSAIYARELMPVKRAALARRGVAVDSDVLGLASVRMTRAEPLCAANVRRPSARGSPHARPQERRLTSALDLRVISHRLMRTRDESFGADFPFRFAVLAYKVAYHLEFR